MFWHCRAREQWVWRGSGGHYVRTWGLWGVVGGDGGCMAVHIRASSTAARANSYGLEWGLGGGLAEVVGARLGEGGEGRGVNNGSCGEASWPRHFSASEFHGGDRGWSPNRKSSGKSPQPHASSRNEGLEGQKRPH